MLNEKQKRFCNEYLKDLNGTQAAIRAGYSKKTANRIANRLLSKIDIRGYVKKLQAKTAEKNEITIQNLLDDLKELKNYGMTDEELEDGKGKGTGKIRKIDPKTAIDAIEKIGRMIGAFEKDNNQTRPNTLQIVVNQGD